MNPSAYKYCVNPNWTYYWLPVSSVNIMFESTKFTSVITTNSNFVDGTRTIYLPETLSTRLLEPFTGQYLHIYQINYFIPVNISTALL